MEFEIEGHIILSGGIHTRKNSASGYSGQIKSLSERKPVGKADAKLSILRLPRGRRLS
jgi:hypothetical protein